MTNPSEVVADLRIAAEDARRFSAALFDRGYARREGVRPFSELLERAADTIDRLTSTGEAVAWRWRAKVNGEWGLWSVVDVDPNDWTWREHWEDLEVVPLYASPREGHVEVPVEPLRKISEIIEKSSTIGAGDFFAIRAMLAALPHNQGETKLSVEEADKLPFGLDWPKDDTPCHPPASREAGLNEDDWQALLSAVENLRGGGNRDEPTATDTRWRIASNLADIAERLRAALQGKKPE